MALTSAEIVTLATQTARLPGFSSQAGQTLNVILQDLCQTYDLAKALKTTTITFLPANGSGPYNLPADYLRMANDELVYQVNGVPYQMINTDLSEFDNSIQVPGLTNYPLNFATDPSQSPVALYCWPPPSGSFVTQMRYYAQMPDITTPESSNAIPWFPNQTYLVRELAGRLLLELANDPQRAQMFLGDDAGKIGSAALLREYLKLQSDDEGRSKTVKFDRRYFGSSWGRLPMTKKIDF